VNVHALLPGQRADINGHVGQALDHIRAVIEASPGCGPVLVEAFRCMSALRKLRDVVNELPEVRRDG